MIGQTAAIIGAAGALTVATVGFIAGSWYRAHQDRPDELSEMLDEQTNDEGHAVALDAPDVGSGLFDLASHARHRGKAKRLAKRGYVKWFKFDGGMLQSPQWIKPEKDGAGVPEYYDSDDGNTYLFPQEPLVTDSETGAPVAVHHKGEAEPVNISNPAHPPIDADRLDKVINLEIESDPPSFFDRVDLSPEMLLFGGIALMLVLGGVSQFM